MKDLTDLFISAYPEMRSATFLLQKTGISRAALNENQAVAKFWAEALAFVDALGRLPQLVEVALSDKSIAAFHPQLRAAHDAYQASRRDPLLPPLRRLL